MPVKSTFTLFLTSVALLFNSCKPLSIVTENHNNLTDQPVHYSEKEEINLKKNFYNGTKERLLGNYELATKYFENCLKIDKYHAASLYELARINDYQKNYEGALAYSKLASDVCGDNDWLIEYYAEILEKNNKYSQAIKIYNNLLDQSPNNLELLYHLINVLLQKNDLKEAIEIFNRVENIVGFDPSISLQRERIYIQLGDFDSAIKELKMLIVNDPEESRYYGMLGELYQMKGNETEAYQTYLQLLKLDPDNPYIHLSLSDYYQKIGNEEKAFQEHKKAFENERLDLNTKISILLGYYRMSQPDNDRDYQGMGFELCAILLKTNPNDPKTHAIYGDFLNMEEGRVGEALDEYKKALELDKTNFIIWNQVLIIESELNLYEDMLNKSNEALSLFPNQPSFYLFNGVANLQNKNLQQAIKSLTIGKNLVIDNNSLLGQFYSNLGDAYHESNNDSASDRAYEDALKIDPNNSYVLNNYSYYLSLRGINLDRAEEMARTANSLQPDSPSYQDTYGWILFQMGKYEQAKEWIYKAINNGGKSSGVILEHYGDVLFKLGDKEGCLKYWGEALKTGFESESLKLKIEQIINKK